MAEVGEFSLIVTEVDAGNLPEAARQFARAFSLDETIATQICKSAPIIFAQKLTKAEVKAITPTLTELSKTGIEFRVTARVAAKLPKLNWPVRPQFTAGGIPGTNGLAFEWENNAFVCPSCGETFLFRRLGKLALAEPPAAVPSNGPVAEVKAMTRASEPARAAVGAGASRYDASAAAPRVEGVEGVQPLAGEGESLDLPETAPVEDIKLEDFPEAPAAEPSAAPAEPMDLLPEAPSEPLDAAAETAPAEELPAAPEPAEPLAETEAPAESGDLYNVFLSKITDTSKRDKAAELIAKVKGCSTAEAKELTTRLVIPLAKNVPKEKAEDILNQFKKLKIFGRMTKVK
jgi:ribosomal protein L7/L12